MTQFVIIDEATRRVLGGRGRRDPVDMTGPPDEMPDAEPGTVLVAWQGALNFSGGFGVMEWLEGATEPTWRDNRAIEDARADKIAEMSSACAASIFAGFTSPALGAEYLYPAKMTDQTNLAGSVLDSLLPSPANWATPFWCADAAGVWEFRMHTATQIQQVGRDAKAAILAAMSYNEALRAQIATATLEQLGAIGWAP